MPTERNLFYALLVAPVTEDTTASGVSLDSFLKKEAWTLDIKSDKPVYYFMSCAVAYEVIGYTRKKEHLEMLGKEKDINNAIKKIISAVPHTYLGNKSKRS